MRSLGLRLSSLWCFDTMAGPVDSDSTLEALLSLVGALRGPAAAIEVEVGASCCDKETR